MAALSDPPRKNETPHVNDHGNSEVGTFWTLCPYCYYMYEFGGVYKECCLRCQNCKRAFHGVPVAPPPGSMVVEGKEQYYCGIGCFPLKYDLGGCLDNKKEEDSGGGDSFLDGKKGKIENLVILSDDSDADDNDCGSGEKKEDEDVKNCGFRLEGEMVKNVTISQDGSLVQENVRAEVKPDEMEKVPKKKFKSVARNTKKLMGRRKKVMKTGSSGDQGIGVGDGEPENAGTNEALEASYEDKLEFFFRENDIYVGLKTDARGQN